jgi:hypothetical protein
MLIMLEIFIAILQRVKGEAAHWTLCLRRSPPAHSTSVSTPTGGPPLKRQMLLVLWRPLKVGILSDYSCVCASLQMRLEGG